MLVCVKVKESMRALHLGRFILLIDVLFLGLPAFAQQDQPPSAPPDAPGSERTDSDSSVSKPTSLPDLTPDANGKLSQQQMRELTRVVAQNYRENYKKLRDYTYVDREVTHKLDGKGQVKSTETKTYEIMELYDEPVARLIEKDDKPLDGKDAAKEEERIQKLADKRKNESEDEQRKQQAEKEKARQKGREFVSEVADAYNFRLVGSEMLNGRDTWVIDGEPRPEFHAQLREAQMLSKFHGRLWIDKREVQLANCLLYTSQSRRRSLRILASASIRGSPAAHIGRPHDRHPQTIPHLSRAMRAEAGTPPSHRQRGRHVQHPRPDRAIRRERGGPGARSGFHRERQLQRSERSIDDAGDATRESESHG